MRERRRSGSVSGIGNDVLLALSLALILAALVATGSGRGDGPVQPPSGYAGRGSREAAVPTAATAIAERLPVQDEDKWVVHVLSRLGYGPRAGDLVRTAFPARGSNWTDCWARGIGRGQNW